MRPAPSASGEALNWYSAGMSKRRPLPVSLMEVPFVVRLPEHEPPFVWPELFGRSGRVEIEIGMGKGLFLAGAAAARPESNFLGVERAEKYFHRAVERFLEAPRPNARVLRADAFDLLTRWVTPGSVDDVHVYFPDPWPKSRHAKRRLLQPELFAGIARALRPGGRFWLGSDVGPYFAQAVKDTLAVGDFDPEDWPDDAPDRILTSYALKYLIEGRRLHYARFVRRNGSAKREP